MTADQEFKISWEWEPAESVRTPEHRATWARIEIKIASDFVTRVEDRESGSARRSIYCPLYPLAEWVAYNWWLLQANTRPSRFLAQERVPLTRVSQMLPTALREHHSIRASGDGFAWPDLVIIPDDSETRLVWGGDSASSSWPIRFLTRGDIRVPGEHVQHELELLVTQTLTRLAEQGVTGSVLEKEWAAIQQTDAEEAEYCRAAARLGLDPYSDEAGAYEQNIIQTAQTLSGPLLEDFLNAVSPDHIMTALEWISSLRPTIEAHQAAWETLDLREAAPEVEALQGLRTAARNRTVPTSAPPWDVGYEQARIVREQIAPDNTAQFAIDRYVTSRTEKAPDAGLQALGAGASHRLPLVIMGQSRLPASNRFTLSRALWHYIYDDTQLFVVTAAHTHRQRMERAFAAELLAPANGIARFLENPPQAASEEELEQIAQRYDVSPMVIEHQLRNHLIAAAA